ncbi:uncharacterized protein LOC115321834 [Ixodes scapularis]|uniref:uncharacterized protein LOC115321834 n=1 Tax=Ixodes scapularis TaxID=6945 RepID=UPI001A9F5B63|nr:uncharacterized protein LOC115321834 [Ixodes scapularis]
MLDMTKQPSFVIEKTKELLHNNLLKLAMERSTSSSGSGVTDITTGEAYDALRRKTGMGDSDLSLTFNTDGSPLFVSSKTSVWPIQFTVNELPPSIRFKHTTLAGLWFGKGHPNMTAFLAKFVDQVKSMTPVMWEHSSEMHRSRAYVLCCCVDAPARAAVQNMVLFNGSFGCPWCLISGEHLEGSMRYVPKEPPAPRTSELVVRDMQLSLRLGITINGIKGPSPLMNLPGFDLVAAVSVEYMHAVLQGAAKQFTELLLSSSNSQKRFYIGAPSCVARVNSRLLQIKPPHCVSRLPRSLNERSFWKASEWRLWLLVYALSCLVDILPLEYWKHLSKLSQAIHILLRETITADEIKRAENLLIDFVGRCEALYGVASLTFNMHQLLHLPNSVRQLGPLWAQSAFVFEGGNGKLVKLVSAARGLPDQIVERVVMTQQLECLLADSNVAISANERSVCERFLDYSHIQNACYVDEACLLGREKAAILTAIEERALEVYGGTGTVGSALEYQRFVYKGQVFHSTAYTRASKSDTTVVSTADGEYFRIKRILHVAGLGCTLLCRRLVLRETPLFPEHIKECFPSQVDICKVLKPEDIKANCLFMVFPADSKCFVCDMPNKIERD